MRTNLKFKIASIGSPEPTAEVAGQESLLEVMRWTVAAAAACGFVTAFALVLGRFPASDSFSGLDPLVALFFAPAESILYVATSVVYLRGASHASREHILARMPWCPILTTILAVVPGAASGGQILLVHSVALGCVYLLGAFLVPLSFLLPVESARVLGRLQSSSPAVAYGHWLWPLVFAIPVVILGDAAAGIADYGTSTPIRLANALLVASVGWLAAALTARTRFAVACALGLYSVFIACDILKMRFLLNTVHPSDVWMLKDLAEMHIFGPSAMLLAIATVGGLIAIPMLLAYGERTVGAAKRRWGLAAGAIATLLALSAGPRSSIGSVVLSRLGGVWPDYSPLQRVRRNGLLLDFALSMNDLYVREPEGYSQQRIAAIRTRYLGDAPRVEASARRVNVIVYLIEAFADPNDLGLRFTQDPIPHFHALFEESGGRAISPVFGGASTNAEFEILTGLTNHFLPANSSPYNQYIHRNLPALPRYLSDLGYRTLALHAERLQAFNRSAVYPFLGFQRSRSLYDDSAAPRDIAGRRPSDAALVDAIITESRRGGPFFMFAFPDSTHLPWDYPEYLGSPLDVVGTTLSRATHDELKTYLNALHTADRAIGRLVAYFRRAKEPTLIVILGDHRPGLSAEAYAHSTIFREEGANFLAAEHRCPVVFWSNFGAPRPAERSSDNFLAATILRATGLPALRFLRVERRVLRASPGDLFVRPHLRRSPSRDRLAG